MPNEAPQPPALGALGLTDEIDMLRKVMRFVEGHADEGSSLNDLVKILDTLGQASTRLCTLLKADSLPNDSSDISHALNEALSEVIRELGTEGTPPRPRRRKPAASR